MNTNHHVANLPGRTHTIPTQYHCRTNLGCYTTILFHACTGLFTKICTPASCRFDSMKWCRMSVDHNVKPLQSTTLHQSWDPSLTRLIHTGQTRLLGYMDDQGRRGGGGYFWCLFWFSLAPHQSLNPNINHVNNTSYTEKQCRNFYMECANNSDDMLAVDQTCAISN